MKKSFSSGILQKSGQAACQVVSTCWRLHCYLLSPLQATITSPMAAEHSSVCGRMPAACCCLCADMGICQDIEMPKLPKYLNVTNLTKFRTRPFFAHFVRNNSALLFSSLVSSARQEAAEQHRQPSWLAGRGQQLPGQSCAVRPVHELRNVVPVDVVA